MNHVYVIYLFSKDIQPGYTFCHITGHQGQLEHGNGYDDSNQINSLCVF